ncbi:MAG: hypothetical protein WEB30_15045 [Cyclobacteriaceae bacterium]
MGQIPETGGWRVIAAWIYPGPVVMMVHQPKPADHLSKLPPADSRLLSPEMPVSLLLAGGIKELFLKILKVMF